MLAAVSLVWIFSPLAMLSETPPIARYLIVISFVGWLPFVVAYLLILWRLRGSPRAGFALALGVGPLVFFSGVVNLVPAAALINGVGDVPRRVLAILALLPLLQIPLTLVAIKGYRQLGGERGGWRTLAAGAGTATICFLIGLALTTVSITHSPIAAADSIALAAIREIGQCAEIYRTDNPAIGYPPTLLSLGPGGAGCIDAGLAEGSKRGHLFEYVSSVNAGLGSRFTVTARPRHYGHTGGRSFLGDETGGIRGSSIWDGNRAATAKDPPL